jgi:hypothetical protein
MSKDYLETSYIMLGATVEEPGKGVCTAGYSPTLRQLMRIQRLDPKGVPHRWSHSKVYLERTDDRRRESWVPYDLPEVTSDPGRLTTPLRKMMNKLDTDLWTEGISYSNQHKRSLALLNVSMAKLVFEGNPYYDLAHHNDTRKSTKVRCPIRPRLIFRDVDGEQNLMLRDRGTFEYLRKVRYDPRRENISKILSLDTPRTLLIGNMGGLYQNRWLIISVFPQFTDTGV